MKVKIDISLKKGVLDTQGKAIENSLNKNLGYEQISSVRQGKFIELEINDSEENVKKIVDDICDGGRTFIELAKEIKKQTNTPIYLIVTHGIFSAGFDKLSDELDGIFCTNSVKDIDFETVKVQSRQGSSDFVKQLNVF